MSKHTHGIPTWPITNLPVPSTVVVMRGIWFDRTNLEKSCEWMRSKLATNDLTTWERKFFTRKLEETNRAMELA